MQLLQVGAIMVVWCSSLHLALIDVQDLDVDFFAFMQMAGPTGIGILYGKVSGTNVTS